MAYSLSARSLTRLFKKAPDIGDVPQGVSSSDVTLDEDEKQLLHDFTRVLAAERPSEIEDIPDERIVEMFASLYKLSSCIEVDNRFTNGTFYGEFAKMAGVLRNRRRRVL